MSIFTCLLTHRLIYLFHSLPDMTTKIHKLSSTYNMHLHKARAIVNILDNYLPYRYISEVINRCYKMEHPVNSQYVKDVKRFQIKDPVVLSVILEFAREKEKAHKRLEQLAKNH